MDNTILNSVKTTRVMNAVAAGTTLQTGTTLDMQGFEGVMFTALFGTLTASAVTGIKVQQGSASDMSDAADLLGSALAIPEADNNKMLITEIYKPTKRYVRCLVTRGTANAVIDGVIAQQFGARVEPPVNGTTVSGSEYSISPAEGTA
jgi:cytochrome c-type biogenesis protein CcmH/NrfF